MELLFESRLDVQNITGKVYFFQHKPQIHPDFVVEGDQESDGLGVSIYGSVLEDGGRYRMWYQAWPRSWDGGDSSYVGYAESEDGIVWEKPTLKLVACGGVDNNLCDLGFHSPSVFIDPDAPSERRYRATGCSGQHRNGAHPDSTVNGYYTAYSSDGLKWTLDSPTPTWRSSDVITSIFHPGRRGGQVAMKFGARSGGYRRRSVWTAALMEGEWTQPRAALIPDDFDDVVAKARGFASGDYYGMGMLPAGQGTVGFLWQFRHRLPRSASGGIFGETDISLTYQAGDGDCWRHCPGRPDFLTHGTLDWTAGGLYSASNVTEVGDEHRLYLTGTSKSHGWYLDVDWKPIEARMKQLLEDGIARIGFARWPKWRLFGFRADPEGTLDIHLGPVERASRLLLNYETEARGSVRVELLTDLDSCEGRKLAGSIPMNGSSISATTAWKGGDVVEPSAGENVVARLHLSMASVFAFQLIPVDEANQK